METNTNLSPTLLNLINVNLAKDKIDIYCNYNDELSKEQITLILEGQSNEVFNELFDNNTDYIYDLEIEYITNILNELSEEIESEIGEFDAKELATELRDEVLDYLNVDMNVKQLIRNTGTVSVRVVMKSNYDCINSHYFETSGGSGGYSYKESYFGAMVDILNLNPAKVKQLLLEKNLKAIGSFPNLKYRDGKEYVSYAEFWQELENNSCGAGELVFVGKVGLEDFVDGIPTTLVIPKGNNCGIFSSYQGGGSVIEMELLRDFKVKLDKTRKTIYDKFELVHDTGKYSIDNVYGVTTKFWGNEISAY